MNAFLDRFCTTHRLGTFQAAKRWATRRGRADDSTPGPQKPKFWSIEDTKGILRYGKKRWHEMKADEEQARMVVPTAVPIEYTDPKAQAAFEAAYRNRLWVLRVAPDETGEPR